MPRLISLTVLAILIFGLGFAFFQVIQPFLLPLFLAAVLAIVFQPLYQYFLRRTNERAQLAAGLTTLAVVLLILIPVILFTFLGAVQLYDWASRHIGGAEWNQTIAEVQEKFSEFNVDRLVQIVQPYLRDELDAQEVRQQITTSLKNLGVFVAGQTLGVAASTFGFVGTLVVGLVGLAVVILGLYFFLADGPMILAALDAFVPIHYEYKRQLLTRFVNVTQAVVIATFAAAASQGIAIGVGLAIAGFHRQFFLLTILATLSALIPLAGTSLVWVPCVLWLAWQGQWMSVVLLSLYAIAIVGTLDNVVRTYVLNANVKLHPLLALISVLGGLQWIGLWGVFIGPIIASCLHALIEIFNTELRELAQERREIGWDERWAVSEGIKASHDSAARVGEDVAAGTPATGSDAAASTIGRPAAGTSGRKPSAESRKKASRSSRRRSR